MSHHAARPSMASEPDVIASDIPVAPSLGPVKMVVAYGVWPVTMMASLMCTLSMVRMGVPAAAVAVLVAAVILAGCTALELWMPFRSDWAGQRKSVQLDLLHILLTEVTAHAVFRTTLLVLALAFGVHLVRPEATGLWSQVGLGSLPLLLQFGLGMLILDFGLYWQHRCFHSNRYFWRVHRVHHSPRQLTATTGIRNHVFGPLVTASLTLAFSLLGPPAEVLVMLSVWIIAKGWLQHANADIRTPWFDLWFPTPRVHRWHHSNHTAEWDNNFGLLCNFWDHVPWHKLPLLGRHMAYQRTTFFLPTDRTSPSLLGLSESLMDDSSLLNNWWQQFRDPLRDWVDYLRVDTEPWGARLSGKALTVLGWPVLIVGAVWGAYSLHHAGWAAPGVSVAVTLGCVACVFALQWLNPLRDDWRGDGSAVRLDLAHILISEGSAHALVTVAVSSLGAWLGWSVGADLWSLLGLHGLPILAQFGLGLLVLDLALYWQHRCMHEVPLLWKTHRIHHAMRTLSPTRTGRHHPLSPAITTLIWASLTAAGLPPVVFVMCQGFAVANGLLQHANVHIRVGPLGRVFASPTFHRWHHSLRPEENNRNFGPNLSVWDQVAWHRIPLLGPRLAFQYTTFRAADDRGPERIGLEETCQLAGRGVMRNWAHQVVEPVTWWVKPALRVLSWPVIVLGSLAIAYVVVRAGAPPMAVVVGVSIGVIGLGLLLERAVPYSEAWGASLTQRNTDFVHALMSGAVPNGLFQGLLLGVTLFFGFALNDWVQGWGLWTRLQLDQAPVLLQFGVALLLLDLCMYWHHRLMHEIPVLWPIHEVHHSASNLTTARAIRNHPVGPLITSAFFVGVGGLGMAPEIFAMVQACLGSVGLLQHTNADLRLGVLNHVFCGPKMHRWHHSALRHEHDRNFSTCLTVWDRFPWHWTPLRPLLRFKHTTMLLPADRAHPTTIGLGDSIPECPDSAWRNWWLQTRYPVDRWRVWWREGR